MRHATVDVQTVDHAASGHRRARATLGHLLVALVLGVLADVGLHLGDDTAFLFVVATPWVVLAFSAGRASGSAWSPVAGAGSLLTGLIAYYVWLHAGLGVSVDVLTGSGFSGITWLVVGAVVGGVAGGVGGLTWHPSRLLSEAAWCGVISVPLADGVIQFAYGVGPPTAAAVVFGGVALILAVLATRAGARLWVLAVGTPAATLLLWQLQLVVLQEAFGRMTWV